MSLIAEVGSQFEHLPDVIEKYTSELEYFENNLKIEGKNLERANIEQAPWLSYYDQRRIELRSLSKYLEYKMESVRGRLWKSYTETYNRELGPKDKEQYINNEPEFLSYVELYLEVDELAKKYEAIVDAFKARGFSLRNITELRIHSLSDVEV